MFDHLKPLLAQRLGQIHEAGLYKQEHLIAGAMGPRVRLADGREVLNLCANNYLGLANHPDILKALAEGVRTYGGGSGASHLISGHSISHQRIDTALAKTQARHISDVHALTLSTGYMANMAILSALVLGFDESESISIFSEEGESIFL